MKNKRCLIVSDENLWTETLIDILLQLPIEKIFLLSSVSPISLSPSDRLTLIEDWSDAKALNSHFVISLLGSHLKSDGSPEVNLVLEKLLTLSFPSLERLVVTNSIFSYRSNSDTDSDLGLKKDLIDRRNQKNLMEMKSSWGLEREKLCQKSRFADLLTLVRVGLPLPRSDLQTKRFPWSTGLLLEIHLLATYGSLFLLSGKKDIYLEGLPVDILSWSLIYAITDDKPVVNLLAGQEAFTWKQFQEISQKVMQKYSSQPDLLKPFWLIQSETFLNERLVEPFLQIFPLRCLELLTAITNPKSSVSDNLLERLNSCQKQFSLVSQTDNRPFIGNSSWEASQDVQVLFRESHLNWSYYFEKHLEQLHFGLLMSDQQPGIFLPLIRYLIFISLTLVISYTVSVIISIID